MNTPWGASQDYRIIAEGIVSHSTARHGGYHLTPERMKEFSAIFPDFKTFAGGPWFEEDQDISAVVIAFPDLFSEEQVYYAVNSVRASSRPFKAMPDAHTRWTPISEYLAQPDSHAAAIAARFRAERLDSWEVGCLGSSGNGWSVSLTRLGDGAQKTAHFRDYPDQGFYNDADLSVLDLANAA